MNRYQLESYEAACPYCGESIELQLDCSEDEQHYIEDCSVCCRPIKIHVMVSDDSDLSVTLLHEDET